MSAAEKSDSKQQQKQKNGSNSSPECQKSSSKRLSSKLSSSDDDCSTLSVSDDHRREKKKKHRATISRWNRWCSWVEEPTPDNGGDSSLYHILDDSGRYDGTEGDEKCCLDVSDSKRLSLMDVLLKDELSFLGKS
jgi:hypothetical protein